MSIGAYHLVDGDPASIPALTAKLLEAPIDLGLIGIGENGHIAFNDPPADFRTTESYICVNLDDRCKRQQVNEGWFPSLEAVPKQAVSMTVYQIMQCRRIVSAVPGPAKAQAIRDTLMGERSNLVPATILKEHPAFNLVVDRESAGMIRREEVRPAPGDGSYSLTVL